MRLRTRNDDGVVPVASVWWQGLSWISQLVVAVVCLWWLAPVVAAQGEEPKPAPSPEVERLQNELRRLREQIEQRNKPPQPEPEEVPQVVLSPDEKLKRALLGLHKMIGDKERERKEALAAVQAAQSAKDVAAAKQAQLAVEAADQAITDARRQIATLAAGADISDFEAKTEKRFDLQAEVVEVLRPFVESMKSATKGPREKSELEGIREVSTARIQRAGEAIEQLMTRVEDPDLASIRPALEAAKERWQNQLESAQSALVQAEGALTAMAEAAQKSSIVDSAARTARLFFKTRGLNLLIGIGAVIGVILLLRMIRRVLSAWRRRGGRKVDRNFTSRLIDIIYYGLIVVASLGALIAVFFVRNDWPLLLLTMILLLAIGWTLFKVLPRVFEQVRLLLNFGAVREGERLMRDGVPWRVERLNLYTVLVNPSLSGGLLRLPVRDLIGEQSRPVGDDEVWFPTETGDWVLMPDGVRAEVVSQSPDLVQIRELGGSLHTYRTEDFIGSGAENISRGYRLSSTFGIDYAHQPDCTRKIPAIMRDELRSVITELIPDEYIQKLVVEFEEAATSSLNYTVVVDLDGRAARAKAKLERAVQRGLVESCNRHGWVIPFQQITLHKASA